MERRDFLRACAYAGTGMCLASLPIPSHAFDASRNLPTGRAPRLREGLFYRSLAGNLVKCDLCPCSPETNSCGLLTDGQVCVCNVRVNHRGKLYVTNYARPSAIHLDPIEKAPLYHVFPGSKSLAIGTAGCNLACRCCQNWEISQFRVEDVKSYDLEPSEIVRQAMESDCQAISFTYTEPAVFYEYSLDTAKIARQKGLKTTVSTGGYINPEPLRLLAKHVDAFSVSIKGFTEEVYRQYCRGSLKTVLTAMETVKGEGAWLEVVALLIPGVSDDPRQIRWFCEWMFRHLGPETPLHFSRFYPSYKLKNLPQTPVGTLEEARKTALSAGLKYVYIGNLPGHSGGNTYCTKCKSLVVQRIGFRVVSNRIRRGGCPSCGTGLPGRWN